MQTRKLSAVTLKEDLWETLQAVKSGKLDPAAADSVAGQAREILRTVKIQCMILSQAKENVTAELVGFAKPEEK